jgi:hypothetical protein
MSSIIIKIMAKAKARLASGWSDIFQASSNYLAVDQGEHLVPGYQLFIISTRCISTIEKTKMLIDTMLSYVSHQGTTNALNDERAK